VKVGDLVMDDRSHMDKTNLFYDALLRYGVIIEIDSHGPGVVTVVWSSDGKAWEQTIKLSRLEVISESR